MANDKYLQIDHCQVGISNSAVFIILCDAIGQQHRFQLSKRASLELAASMADVTSVAAQTILTRSPAIKCLS
jgi:hypothetical protein